MRVLMRRASCIRDGETPHEHDTIEALGFTAVNKFLWQRPSKASCKCLQLETVSYPARSNMANQVDRHTTSFRGVLPLSQSLGTTNFSAAVSDMHVSDVSLSA